MNVALVPEWKNFIPQLQSPPHNTVNGVHYGISLQWGPNTLLYNTKPRDARADELGVDLQPEVQGRGHRPDNPIQIADAALYLSKTQPSLGITDPYELTEAQLNAAVDAAQAAAPADQEVLGAGLRRDRTVQERRRGDRRGVAATRRTRWWPPRCRSANSSRSEGATGWADTWMLVGARRSTPTAPTNG